MDDILLDLKIATRNRDNEIEGSERLGLSFHSNELGGEVGELQNQIKKLDRFLLGLGKLNKERYPVEVIENIREEVADVIICLVKLLYQIDREFGEDINLRTEIKKKFNKFSHQNNLKTFL